MTDLLNSKIKLNTEDLRKFLQENKFVIYGNGHVAHRFYHQLQRMKCEGNVDKVAVTEMKEEMIGVNNRPIHLIKNIDRKVPIIIATHISIVHDMRKILDELGFIFFVWIYPYLFDLEFGEPIQRNVRISLKDLIENLSKSYNPVIIYLSLKDYCNKNIFNGSLYRKMMRISGTDAVAKKRWERFRDQIDTCLQYGFQQDYNIKIQEDYVTMDGWHRLMLAQYFEKSFLFADMYSCIGFYSKNGIEENSQIQEQDLPKYFTNEEIQQIKQTAIELRGAHELL